MAKVLTLLGFAQRAGKLASGESASLAQLKKGRARLVLLAEDASHRTKETFRRLSAERGVPCRIYGNKDQLGLALGRTPRSVLTVLDQNFSDSILKGLTEE